MPLLVLCDVVVHVLETILLHHMDVLRDDSIRSLDAILDVANFLMPLFVMLPMFFAPSDVVDVGHLGSTNLMGPRRSERGPKGVVDSPMLRHKLTLSVLWLRTPPEVCDVEILDDLLDSHSGC